LTVAGDVATLEPSEGAGMGDDDARTIDGLKSMLVRALEQGDAALAASLYAPDARVLPPGAPPITGDDALLDFWQRRIDGGSDGGVLETVRREEFGSSRSRRAATGGEPASSGWTAASTWRSSAVRPTGRGGTRPTSGTPTRADTAREA
jgi:ketosteroid isomerase-like protein